MSTPRSATPLPSTSDSASTEPTVDLPPARVAETSRPETPELEGRVPLPEELTGRASATQEDLTTLFANEDADHLADGFRGGSDDEITPGL